MFSGLALLLGFNDVFGVAEKAYSSSNRSSNQPPTSLTTAPIGPGLNEISTSASAIEAGVRLVAVQTQFDLFRSRSFA